MKINSLCVHTNSTTDHEPDLMLLYCEWMHCWCWLLFNDLVRKPQSKLEQKISAQSSAIKQHHNSRFCYNCRSAWQMYLTCLPIAWFIIISWTPKNSVLSSKAKCTTTKQHVILISGILCPIYKGCNLWLQAAELVLKSFQPQTPAIMFKNWLQIHRTLPVTRPRTDSNKGSRPGKKRPEGHLLSPQCPPL